MRKEAVMRIANLVWHRKHNIASLNVSYGRRIWHTQEVDDLILGYNATGRLCRVIMLDPRRLLPPDATTADAIDRVTEKLLRLGAVRQPDLDVLRSALDRADVRKVS